MRGGTYGQSASRIIAYDGANSDIVIEIHNVRGAAVANVRLSQRETRDLIASLDLAMLNVEQRG